MLETGFIVFLVFLLVGVSLMFVFSYLYSKKLNNTSMTKGMTGLAGQPIQLQCPEGQVISFTNSNPTTTRGAIVCSGDSNCDGFFGDQLTNFFNSNTINVFSDTSFTDIQSCAGKQNCSWTVPVKTDPRLSVVPCLQTCAGQLQFIGTYDCVASS